MPHKQYRLLKDLPGCEAGTVFTREINRFYADNNKYAFSEDDINTNPDWFTEVIPFEWTDELVYEYGALIHMYYQKYREELLSIEDFKRSKQQP